VAAELLQDAGGEALFSMEDRARHVRWLRDAEALLLSYLVRENGDPT
jgi:hypothetical protein